MEIIVKDFTDTPRFAKIKDGQFSGEQFREDILKPKFNQLLENVKADSKTKETLNISMSGVYGYTAGWLEEAFAGMVFYCDRDQLNYLSLVTVIHEQEPYLTETVNSLVADALLWLEKIEADASKEAEKKSPNSASVREKSSRNTESNSHTRDSIGPPDHILIDGKKVFLLTGDVAKKKEMCMHGLPKGNCTLCSGTGPRRAFGPNMTGMCEHNMSVLVCPKCKDDDIFYDEKAMLWKPKPRPQTSWEVLKEETVVSADEIRLPAPARHLYEKENCPHGVCRALTSCNICDGAKEATENFIEAIVQGVNC